MTGVTIETFASVQITTSWQITMVSSHPDNLVLLAPGPTPAFGDDVGIAFVAGGNAVTPASFGVLSDSVLPAQQETSNDNAD